MADKILNHEIMTEPGSAPDHWLYLLHGIFGAGRNWASLIRRVIRERPEWGAVLVDLREHGGSQGFAPPHTLAAAAADLRALVESLGHPSSAVVGHSFGGKVALEYASQPGQVDLGQVWVIDSTPDSNSLSAGSREMLEIIRRYPGPFESRDELVQALTGEGVAVGIAHWMATNIEPAQGSYRWRIDFDAIGELLEDFFRADLWEIVESEAGPTITFVKAETGSVISDQAVARIEAAGRDNGRVSLYQVTGGHWLNADNPDAVVRLLVDHL